MWCTTHLWYITRCASIHTSTLSILALTKLTSAIPIANAPIQKSLYRILCTLNVIVSAWGRLISYWAAFNLLKAFLRQLYNLLWHNWQRVNESNQRAYMLQNEINERNINIVYEWAWKFYFKESPSFLNRFSCSEYSNENNNTKIVRKRWNQPDITFDEYFRKIWKQK